MEFYDNVNFKEEDKLVRQVISKNRIRHVKLDALYYIDCFNSSSGRRNIDTFTWHEKIGFKSQKNISYSTGEMQVAYNYANAIVDNIIKPNDSVQMKIAVIYAWIIKNVMLEDSRIDELNEGIVNVFKFRVASYPTVAKFYQFLLRVAGIESYDIKATVEVSGQ